MDAASRWRFGPVRARLLAHPRGIRAETLARPLLADALGCDPQALPLHRDEQGRPLLDAPFTGHDINWSHSGDFLLVGLGEGVRLGIDLELIRPRPRAMELAQRFFHATEIARLEALADDARQQAFIRLWCAKEAVLKAHGRGLSFGLHRLLLDDTTDGLQLLWCDPELGIAGDWILREWVPLPGYRAVLAWRPMRRG